MKVKPHCSKHPNAQVLMLEATMRMQNDEGFLMGTRTDEDLAAEVTFDVANTYCPVASQDHEICFKIYDTDGHWLADAE